VAKGAKLRVSDIVLSRRRSCHTRRNKKNRNTKRNWSIRATPLRPPAMFLAARLGPPAIFTAAGVVANLTLRPVAATTFSQAF